MEDTFVLLCGLSQDNVEYISRILTTKNLTAEAVNGSNMEVFAQISVKSYSLLIFDLDGVEDCEFLIEVVRRRFSYTELPILLMMDSSRYSSVVAFLESGANHYIFKPFEENQFLNKIIALVSPKVLQRELLEQNLAVERAAKLMTLGKVSGGVVHEIRNPLTIILGKLNSLDSEVNVNGEINIERVDKDIDSMRYNIIRVNQIIKSIQLLAHQGVEDRMEFERISVTQLLNETLVYCNEKLINYGVEFQIIPYDKSLEIDCARIDFSRVILNLVSNAIDAVSDCPIKKVQLQVLEQGDSVFFNVLDSGKPIKLETKKKMFETFYTTKAKGRGTGLGLSLASHVVKNHGGELYLDEQSVQTKFVVRLPKMQKRK